MYKMRRLICLLFGHRWTPAPARVWICNRCIKGLYWKIEEVPVPPKRLPTAKVVRWRRAG